jgi:hypothetical protein
LPTQTEKNPLKTPDFSKKHRNTVRQGFLLVVAKEGLYYWPNASWRGATSCNMRVVFIKQNGNFDQIRKIQKPVVVLN